MKSPQAHELNLMQMKNFKKTTLFFLFLVSSFSAIGQTFKITGKTIGVDDGTWLYLKTSSPQEMLDSTKVMDGKFNLIGKVDEKAAELLIHTKNFTNYLFFWAEQNTYLELKDGEFKKALIKGSKTHDENKNRLALKQPNEKLQDSLSALITVTKDEILKKELRKQLREAQQIGKEMDINYIKNNPNSLIAANLLQVYATTWGKEKVSELYQNLSAEIKNTSYGKNVKDFISLNQQITIGGKFADFEQTNTLGKKIKLSDIKAKYILLEFWGSWCGPCREENPRLVKTYQTFKAKGFEVLGVAADDNKAQWLKAVKDDQLPWQNVSDLRGDKNHAALVYGVSGYPTNYLIDDKGIIIAKDLRGEALNKKLAELLP